MKYQPQLAKLPSKTFDRSQLHAPEWHIERKWDGMRALFEVGETETRIFSRTGQDLCPQFPELCDLHERLPVPCILDGEIIALRECECDTDPDIELCQEGFCPAADWEDLERLQLRLGDKLARRREEVPVEVRFFDILEFGAHDFRGLPLSERLVALDRLCASTDYAFSPPETLSSLSYPLHWEGVIAKRTSSTYSGKRSGDWLKFKTVHRATLRVTGLTPGKNKRASSFGAATVSDATGVHRGQVGAGFTDEQIEQMLLRMVPTPTFPLIEVEYRFLSKTGLLVNTAFKGFRADKVEADVL